MHINSSCYLNTQFTNNDQHHITYFDAINLKPNRATEINVPLFNPISPTSNDYRMAANFMQNKAFPCLDGTKHNKHNKSQHCL